MHGSMRVTERTSLTRPTDTPDYVEFASLLRTRRSRIKQFQCCICATLIAVFTMALVVTISYSVNHDAMDSGPNVTSLEAETRLNLTGPLKLGFVPGSGSYTLYSTVTNVPGSNSIFVTNGKSGQPMTRLSNEEFKLGLEAGRQAINDRLSADAAALASPLRSPSPESRHRYAVSTCVSVGALALAAVAEIAATKRIESSRSILGEPSSIGNFFDGGWVPQGICKELLVPNCTIGKYRTFDGTCNRPMQWGAAMTPYRRSLPSNYANGIDAPRKALSGKELPSAREVSIKVHKPSPSSNPAFSVMLAVYGQFLDHDITATAISQGVNGSSISCCPPSVGHPECFPVRIGPGDPVFDAAGTTCMDFLRSAPAPQCMLGPREQLNQVTAFIDGSTIYGSDLKTAQDLREFAGGRLRMQMTSDNRTLLPPSTNPNDGCNREAERLRGRYCFAAGDARANENLHLTTMHLIWARQHNLVAEELAKINPHWDDETLYQEARRVIGAQLQHITYEEFIPIVLGDDETSLRNLRPLKSGYRQWIENPDDPNYNPSIANSFASSAFRFAHTLLPGLMMVTDEQKGTSSYVELHRMLFNPYSLYVEGGVKSSITSATGNVIQMTSTHVTSQLTSHLFQDPVGNSTTACGLDLVSLNIQRGRDHGLPGYTEWREYCGLGKPETFADLAGYVDPEVLQEMTMLYESVHDVDLYTGALAEIPRPGAIVGPTFSYLIADQFTRLQKGDRYWYETANRPGSFTEGQLQELRKSSLARLICDCSDGVTQTQAEVMRAAGPDNPIVSCEDIPRPSFEPWREDKPDTAPFLNTPLTPLDWVSLKNHINETIRDVVSYINNTATTDTPMTSDWLDFKNYINDTFTELRNELAGLHPPRPVEMATLNERSSMDASSFILRASEPPNVTEDWLNFKTNILKLLNTSMSNMGGGGDPAIAMKWAAFKQNIVDQFADLKNQIAAAKTDLAPNLLLQRYKEEEAILTGDKRIMEELSPKEIATTSAIFDWKNFKDDILSSLDDTIGNIGDNMPPPGDPVWATFRPDIKDRFSAFRDKINVERSTVPTELATGGVGTISDWLSFKADIVRTVNDAVQKVQDGMPPPGDPAWASYRDEVMKSFSSLKVKPPGTSVPSELATSSIVTGVENKGVNLGIPSGTGKELSNLTDDWLDFRSKINDSLARVVQDIESKKSAGTIDPLGWIAFKNSAIDEFARLKNEISGIKTEWVTEINKTKGKDGQEDTSGPINTLADDSLGDLSKFGPATGKTFIPPADWIAFKEQINDTVMNFLHSANSTEKTDFTEIRGIFSQSFDELKNDIASLKDLSPRNTSLPKDTGNPTKPSKIANSTADWIRFRSKINSTLTELLNSLKNESETTIGEVMKILFKTRDKFSKLKPPSSLSETSPPYDWQEYASGINKSVTDTLKNVGDSKRLTLMLKAPQDETSSSVRPTFHVNWLIVPCAVSLLDRFAPILELKVCSGC